MRHKKMFIRRNFGSALLLWIAFSTVGFSQSYNGDEKINAVNRAVLFTVGPNSIIDTYLSPLEYKGTNLSLLYEQLNGSRFFDRKLLLQQRFQVEFSTTDNPAETSSEYYGNVAYGLNGLYPVYSNEKLRLYGGAGWDLGVGGIYNMRNSNNPGSLKIATNLNLNAMALYNWKNCTFRWQLTSPFLGVFFSPGYGQSYYEIFSLGNDDGTVVLGSFATQQALKNYFTVDFPVGNFTIRTGYLGNYYRTKVHDITTKILSHQFVIGFVTESLNFGGKKIKQHNWLNSVYY